ncbi:MAG: hypothetical protein KY476_01220 [Planctomycetes bacterium]|nr:hypothetical protein [Planctomycetota bacterium]
MFSADEIEERIKLRPFQPVRIVSSSGHTYDVFHPDMVLLGQSSIIVGIPGAENPKRYDQTARLSLFQITALEDLPAPAPTEPHGNGQE